MDIDVYSRQELDTVFRVLRTALRPAGALEPRERRFLETYARITGYHLMPTDPLALAPVARPSWRLGDHRQAGDTVEMPPVVGDKRDVEHQRRGRDPVSSEVDVDGR